MQDDNVKTVWGERTIWRSVSTSLLIQVTIACVGLAIFCPNVDEMAATPPQVLAFLGGFIVVGTLLCSAFQMIFALSAGKERFAIINAMVLAFGLLLWIQGNVFAWNFGELNGAAINWGHFRLHAWGEVLCWLLVLGVIIRYRNWFSQHSVRLATILIAVQLFSLPAIRGIGGQVIKPTIRGEISTETASWKNYEYTLNGLFDYSKDADVYLVILDAFGSKLFNEIIDEDTSYQDIFRDFTYFPKCYVPLPATTMYSVPRILTGYDNNSRLNYSKFFHEAWSQKYALLDTLTRNGYQCSVCTESPSKMKWDSKWVANIRPLNEQNHSERSFAESMFGIPQQLNLIGFRLTPTVIKPAYFHSFCLADAGGTNRQPPESDKEYMKLGRTFHDAELLQIINNTEWQYKPGQKQFKYFHLQGAHHPYTMNEQGVEEELTGADSEIRQAKGTLFIVKTFLDKLRQHETYNNSLIIVMADHGPHNESVAYGMDASTRNRPLLLVKRPNMPNDVLQVSNTPVFLIDTTPAILTELGLEHPDDAFSWFNMPQKLAEIRNQHWNEFVKQNNTDTPSMTLAAQSVPIGSEVPLLRKSVSIVQEQLRVELAGNDGDVIDQFVAEPVIALIRNGDKATQYITKKIPIGSLLEIFADFWTSEVNIDLHGVTDGKYEIVVLLPGKNNQFARLGNTVVVANGLVQNVEILPKQNNLMQAEKARTIR